MKKIIIAGASGFVGSLLNENFTQKGYKVIAIQRADLNDIEKLSSLINGSFAVINLAGANIINRWSDEYKKLLYSSRINTTRSLAEAMKKCEIKPKKFISTSAVGIYKNDKKYDESTTDLSNDFLGALCQDWEKEALKATELDISVSIFRFGIVMGKGGALSKMITPFKLGVGGTIGDGKQSFSFIHIEDLISAYNFVLEDEKIDGIFNLTAPIPTTNYGLTKALGKSLHRPTILPIPQFVLNIILSEGAKVLTDGQSALPNHLLNKGFIFKYKNIEETIENLV
ncbi:MAG: TIGR01777 family oxidoreductase [Arcobacteraceae bacterium]